LREEFAYEPDILLRALPSGDKAWIVAYATITPELADQAQEFAFPATYLQHGLAANIVAADELLGDGAVEGVECGGEALGLLVLIRIDRVFRVPNCIEDKAASTTQRKYDITGRESQRLGSILYQ
jgi:hypothetical protein